MQKNNGKIMLVDISTFSRQKFEKKGHICRDHDHILRHNIDVNVSKLTSFPFRAETSLSTSKSRPPSIVVLAFLWREGLAKSAVDKLCKAAKKPSDRFPLVSHAIFLSASMQASQA